MNQAKNTPSIKPETAREHDTELARLELRLKEELAEQERGLALMKIALCMIDVRHHSGEMAIQLARLVELA